MEPSEPPPETATKDSAGALYFEWDAAHGTFLCPIGRPMSPRDPDPEQQLGTGPIPGTYVATNCSICPLAARCLSRTDLKIGKNRQLSVGRSPHQDRGFRHPVGHASWRESSEAERLLRSQHAEGRFLSLKHLRQVDELPYKGTDRNGAFALLGGISYNARRAIDLAQRKLEVGAAEAR
jgi:hypothetical protein